MNKASWWEVREEMQKERKNMPLAQPAKRQQDSGNKMFRITPVFPKQNQQKK